jgi:hypothetical protein
MRDCKLLNHMRIRRRLKCGGCSGQCGCKTKVIPAVVTVDHVLRHEARQFLRGWCRRQRDARVVNFLLMELVKAIRCGNCQETECTDEIGCPVGLGTIVEARKFFRAGCRHFLPVTCLESHQSRGPAENLWNAICATQTPRLSTPPACPTDSLNEPNNL